MSITFIQLARKVLEEEKRPLSAPEIWSIVKAKGYEKEVGSEGKTPWNSLGARLYVEVRDNLASEFVPVGARPKRFGLRSMDKISAFQSDIPPLPQLGKKKKAFTEKDLHPFIVYYGFLYLKAFLKTIRHNKSGKKEFGEWIHPDIVGCYYPFNDWKGEVVEVSSLMGNAAIKLYSFELKRELSIANLRESFFQAVSNSSWANECYLAAAEIDNDEDFQTELKRLSTSFGVGIIRIDVEDPDSTEIILPAKPKDIVDWETVNKLAGINPDFQSFLKRIKIDLSSREIRQEMYDQVWEREALIDSITKKKES
ncbi:MAG: hypothetical protein IT426_02485 [Pirellulales bacterium]|nr:hypothetical protein [Pirellulales bacterium]